MGRRAHHRIWVIGLALLLASGSPLAQETPLQALQAQTRAVLDRLPAGPLEAPPMPGFQRFAAPTAGPSAPASAAQRVVGVLDLLNGALFRAAWREGLLHHLPSVRTAPVDGAEVWVLPGLQLQTVVSTAVRPDAALGLPTTLDPVLARWFVLLHEAAHTELGELPSPFVHAGWSPVTNQAVSDLLFDPGRLGSASFGVFDETFGDVYGALMLLRLAPDRAAAIRVVEAMRDLRDAERAHRLPLVQDGLFDPHAQVDGLGDLCRRLARADYRGWLDAATPDQLRQEALAQTSAQLVAWWRAHPEQVQGDFDWARPQPEEPAILRVTETQRLIAFRQTRALSYLLAPWAEPTAAQAQTFGAPLFRAQLAADPTWQASLQDTVSEGTRHTLTAFVQGAPPPKGQPPALEAEDLQAWTHATTDAVLTAPVLAEDAAWLAARHAALMAGLAHDDAPDSWASVGP
jgi:hypothetical protein